MRRRAFTLIELLISMALLVALGALLTRFVSGSLELWRKAETQRELGEKSVGVFEMLGRDLRAVHPSRLGEGPAPNRARFRCEFAVADLNGDRSPETVTRRLRFLRALGPGEEWQALLSEAWREKKVGAEGEIKVEVQDLADGLAEVAWATAPDPAAGDPAVLSLLRGLRPAAFDPKGSFFRDGFFSAPRTLGGDLREVVGGVLEFALLFPLPRSKGWRETDPERPGGGTCASWDSTRSASLDLRAHPGNRFALDRDETSEKDSRDDVFPTRALATLVLERRGPGTKNPRLAGGLGTTDLTLEIDDARSLPRSGRFLAKVEGEWIEVSRVTGTTLALSRRGARDTIAAAHPAGTALHVGETFRAEFVLDAGREDWNG